MQGNGAYTVSYIFAFSSTTPKTRCSAEYKITLLWAKPFRRTELGTKMAKDAISGKGFFPAKSVSGITNDEPIGKLGKARPKLSESTKSHILDAQINTRVFLYPCIPTQSSWSWPSLPSGLSELLVFTLIFMYIFLFVCMNTHLRENPPHLTKGC